MKILLVVYDNGSHIHNFPLGTAYVASVLLKNGHDVRIYSQDVYHWEEEHLTSVLDRENFDAVGLGFIAGYYQYGKILKISSAINASRNRPPHYILGGHGPSPEPEFFLRKTGADFVIIGEGEDTITALLKALEDGSEIGSVKGIAYRNNGHVSTTPRRGTIKDLNRIPFPAWDMFPMDVYPLVREFGFNKTTRIMPVLSGRGCPYRCNFCYRMDPGYRPRKPEDIGREIRELQATYGIGGIEFLDELLMLSPKRVKEVCDVLGGLDIQWACSGRLNCADHTTLTRMKDAGCIFINYGIESIDDETLRVMNKKLTVKQIVAGVENTIDVGINQGLNIIFGNIGETKEALHRGVDFLEKYSDGCQLRTIRPVTPYPGSGLYTYCIKKGLILDAEDFYQNKHLNSDLLAVNLTNMTDVEYYEELKAANMKLIGSYHDKHRKAAIQGAADLYDNLDTSFRGFRQM